MRPTTIKLGLAVIGLATFFYGRHIEDDRLRWLAMAFLVAAFLLRFWKPRQPPRDPPASAERESTDGGA